MNSASGNLSGAAGLALPVGKQRGLRAVSTPGGVFAVLALDHLSALGATIRPDAPDTVPNSQLAETKVQLVDRLAEHASGVLIDPVVGLGPLVDGGGLPSSVGLMLGLEDGDYASPDIPPQLFSGWDVARAMNSGAAAVKCSFWYNPFEPSDAAHQFVTDLVADCGRLGIPLFAEPLSSPTARADRRRIVVETARNVGALGVDVLKLEFPSSRTGPDATVEWRDACSELSEVSPRPWTLLSAGTDFDTFAGQLSIACESGASGYVAGRAVWQNLVAEGVLSDGPTLDEARRRMSTLTGIATSAATPWIDWFDPIGEGQSDERSSRS